MEGPSPAVLQSEILKLRRENLQLKTQLQAAAAAAALGSQAAGGMVPRTSSSSDASREGATTGPGTCAMRGQAGGEGEGEGEGEGAVQVVPACMSLSQLQALVHAEMMGMRSGEVEGESEDRGKGVGGAAKGVLPPLQPPSRTNPGRRRSSSRRHELGLQLETVSTMSTAVKG